MYIRLIGMLIALVASLQASYIVLGNDPALKTVYQQMIQTDQTLQRIVQKQQLHLKEIDVAGNRLIGVGDFSDESAMALFYMHIKPRFPQATIIHTPQTVIIKKIVPVEVQQEAPPQAEADMSIWIALFGLAVIALFALYLSSEEIKLIKKEHEKMQAKQDEIIEIQNRILTNMSENIHSIAEQAAKETKDLVLSSSENSKLERALKRVARSENRLLDITTDLLEFLRIKSNKITVVNEKFQLINLLNDITGQVSVTDKHIDFDLLYDIDESVPPTLIGDTLHLSKIAVNIIDYFKQNGAKSVVVEIKREGSFASAELVMRFKSDLIFDIENDQSLFVSQYNEETNQYEGLNLYVAKELAIKMGADLFAKNAENKTAQFVFKMPFKKVPLGDLVTTKQTIPKELEFVRILLVDKNKECLSIDAKIFENIGLEVTGTVRREFNHNNFDFTQYNIAIIDEALFTTELLKKLVRYEDLKIVSLNSIFVESKLKDSLDAELKRPLTTSQLVETLTRLYNQESERTRELPTSKVPVHREKFADTPNVTLESFADFAGASLLIVEDNFINQKVLLSVLKKSGMDIDIANNGREAVELVRQKGHYDIILMDINMPVMDGYTATQQIRQEGFDDIPIVALSALTSTDEINKMFDVGMNGYLAKPFYKERLYTVFDIFIGKKHTDKSAKEAQKQERAHDITLNDELLGLEGLDVRTGLENSKNCELFYKEVLQEFKDAFGQSGELFEKLVSEHRYEQIKMLAIDIRGLSGAIGAQKLHELTIEILQTLLFKKYDLLESYVEKFKNEMERLNRDIEVYLNMTA